MFFTLTFPKHRAPDEAKAHHCLRSLVGRLRYRQQLGAYGWVLQRQGNGTLHYHGIAHMPWQDDGLATWRGLIERSGFGPMNKLVLADENRAGYCAKYISARLADLAPLHRAYGFSQTFSRSPRTIDRAEQAKATKELLAAVGAEPECHWVPLGLLAAS